METQAPYITPASKLTTLWQQLVAAARSAPGETHRRTLTGGARLAVRVVGDYIAVTIARVGAEVGAVEERTFKRDLGIPPEAQRLPRDGQLRTPDDQGWLVGYTWTLGETGKEVS